MMLFLRKSLLRKFLLTLVVFGVVIGVVTYFSIQQFELPYYFVLAPLLIFLLIFGFVYWYQVIRPLKPVLREMQALLTGKLYKRIFTKRVDEVGVIAHFFNQVTKGLGRVSSDLQDRERMLDELTIASQLQRDILPVTCPSAIGMQIVAKNKPATELGGDSFGMITVKNRTYIYIGDVTGHGVAAGIIMTMVNSLINVFSNIYDSPYDILVNVNKYVKKHVKKAMFMTMALLSWDYKTNRLDYVGAGHEHILVYRMDSGECESLMTGGVAIGMTPDNSKLIKEHNLKLNDGDFVILYTDGITEARNAEEELYGLERLIQSVKEYCPQYGAEGVNYHIAKDVSDFQKGHIQDDDMTLIVMKRDSALKSASSDKEQSTVWHEDEK